MSFLHQQCRSQTKSLRAEKNLSPETNHQPRRSVTCLWRACIYKRPKTLAEGPEEWESTRRPPPVSINSIIGRAKWFTRGVKVARGIYSSQPRARAPLFFSVFAQATCICVKAVYEKAHMCSGHASTPFLARVDARRAVASRVFCPRNEECARGDNAWCACTGAR